MPDSEQELNEFWNALITDEPTTVSPALDAEEQALLRRIHRLGKASPGGMSAERAWPMVLARIKESSGMKHSIQEAHTPEIAWPSFGVSGRLDAQPGRSPRLRMATERRQWMVTQFATAALLAFTFVASLVAFGPWRPGSSGPPRDQQVVATAVATPGAGTLEFLWQFTGGADPSARMADPYGIGIDPAGNVWIAGGRYNRFQIIAPDGTFLETWGTPGSGDGEFKFSSNQSGRARGFGDVAFDPEGNIYVADTGNARVQKFAPDRSFLLAWGSEGKGDGQFVTPSGIAIDAEGIVYVSDEGRSDVQKFDSEGQFLETIGAPGSEDGQFWLPAGVAIDGNGEVWIADYNNYKIQRFTSAGEWLDAWGQVGAGEGELNGPNDVAVDQFGRVYVADDGNSRLQVFSADGQVLATTGSVGNEPGQFHDVLGVAVGEDGTVYVSGINDLQAFRFVPADG
jgi:DNA-binding beta-propeller fold protein YncE